MTWAPVSPLETFAETVSVPAWIHTRPGKGLRVLILGSFASPLATLSLRFPDTAEVLIVGENLPLPSDKRVVALRSLSDIPDGWQADVGAMALPLTPTPAILALTKHVSPDGVAVVAIDDAPKARGVKNFLRDHWTHVLPYRTYAPDLSMFFLLSNRKLGTATRPWPQGLKKLCPPYLSSLFALAKDEYQFLYGAEAC